MHCEHCLRGEAQDKDISFEAIDRLLESTDAIWELTLTGGEPSLNVPAIEYITKRIQERDIELGNVFIATNGKEVSDEFLLACMKLFMITHEKDLNMLALSQDMFHEDIPQGNIEKLEQLAVFDKECKHADFNRVALIDLGRAKDLDGFTKRTMKYSGLDAFVADHGNCLLFRSIVTATVDGDLLTDCDYDYDSTDNIKFGNLFDPDWVERVAAECADGAA